MQPADDLAQRRLLLSDERAGVEHRIHVGFGQVVVAGLEFRDVRLLLPPQRIEAGEAQQGKGTAFIHTLNASGLATSRLLPAIAPHVIGAPVAPHGESIVPAELVARFVANSIAANAMLWCVIGLFLGLVLDRTAKDIYAT
mgnify:CR=1 FL=1